MPLSSHFFAYQILFFFFFGSSSAKTHDVCQIPAVLPLIVRGLIFGKIISFKNAQLLNGV